MSSQAIFQTHLILGYVACLLCFGTYILPRLRSIGRFNAQRIFATIHSFRFFGLVFLLPGVVGSKLPAGFAVLAAYGDLITGVLALLALLSVRIRPMFWFFIVAFNVVGATDLLVAYYHAICFGLPYDAGQLGAAYMIPIFYVPMLMITHAVALIWLVWPERKAAQTLTGGAASYLG